MDVRYVNPVLESILNVLGTMANIQPTVGKPSIKSDKIAQGVVTGIIDLKGKQASGSVAISFSKPVALELAKNMLRMELEDVDDMVQDLVGEMANMVAGGAKAKLDDEGYDFELSLPSVIAGVGHSVDHGIDGPTIVLPFTTDKGGFSVEICFR